MDENARKLFEQFCSRTEVDNIKQIESLLPSDPGVISALASLCQSESRTALRAGRHMEGRRLGLLGEQLYRRALGIRGYAVFAALKKEHPRVMPRGCSNYWATNLVDAGAVAQFPERDWVETAFPVIVPAGRSVRVTASIAPTIQIE